jgi:hypothetical protein
LKDPEVDDNAISRSPEPACSTQLKGGGAKEEEEDGNET